MNPVHAVIVVLGMSGSAAGLAGLVRWWHHRKEHWEYWGDSPPHLG